MHAHHVEAPLAAAEIWDCLSVSLRDLTRAFKKELENTEDWSKACLLQVGARRRQAFFMSHPFVSIPALSAQEELSLHTL
jgi:hypothetical protein